MTTTIATLPYELKVYIFSFLNDEELTKIATVSKEWNDISSSDYLWQRRVESLISKDSKFLNEIKRNTDENAKSFYFRLLKETLKYNKEIDEKILEESRKVHEKTEEIFESLDKIYDKPPSKIGNPNDECMIM